MRVAPPQNLTPQKLHSTCGDVSWSLRILTDPQTGPLRIAGFVAALRTPPLPPTRAGPDCCNPSCCCGGGWAAGAPSGLVVVSIDCWKLNAWCLAAEMFPPADFERSTRGNSFFLNTRVVFRKRE